MSLSKMKLVNIIGNLTDVDDVVSALGATGVFQPDEAAEFFSDSESLIPLIASNDFSPIMDTLSDIIKRSGLKPKILSTEKYDNADVETVRDLVDKIESELGAKLNRKDEIESRITADREIIEKTRHFVGLGIDIDKIHQCEYIVTRFGRLTNESYKKLSAYSDNPYVEFFPCTHDGRYYWGVYAAPLEEAPKIDRIFSRLYFEKVDITGMKGTPKEYITELESEIIKLKQEEKDIDSSVSEYVKEHELHMLELFTSLCKHQAYLSIKNHACKYHNSFVLIGWIPANQEGTVLKALDNIDSVEITFTKASEERKHSPPVKLKNIFFFKPFEYYTEMYGMPGYSEIDPSWFIALTYTLLFGIMFADVGQGILLLLAAIFMYKKRKMPIGALLIPCSICSTIFGFIFGSVFGFEDLLDPVYRDVFHMDGKPFDVLEGQTTMMLIYSAVGIGIALLIIAMMLNVISCFKRKDIGGALFGVNGLAGLTFYSSLLAGLVVPILTGVQIMNTLYVLLLIVLPLVLIFLREPLTRLIEGERPIIEGSIGSFITDNIFEMFEVALSYVTNTMSFLRVGAFILVHAGMMKVVFVLAEMFSPVGYVITVIVGNIIVMALEALLVGIQVLRLEYYEMFSRFYIGDGRKYEPVTVENKIKS